MSNSSNKQIQEILDSKKCVRRLPQYGLRKLSVGFVPCLLAVFMSFAAAPAGAEEIVSSDVVVEKDAATDAVHERKDTLNFARVKQLLEELKTSIKTYEWHLEVLSGDSIIDEADYQTLEPLYNDAKQKADGITNEMQGLSPEEAARINQELTALSIRPLPNITSHAERDRLEAEKATKIAEKSSPQSIEEGTSFYGYRNDKAGEGADAAFPDDGGVHRFRYRPTINRDLQLL